MSESSILLHYWMCQQRCCMQAMDDLRHRHFCLLPASISADATHQFSNISATVLNWLKNVINQTNSHGTPKNSTSHKRFFPIQHWNTHPTFCFVLSVCLSVFVCFSYRFQSFHWQAKHEIPFHVKDERNASSPYTLDDDPFNFIIYLFFSNTHISANDGKWHHICATWENTAGAWKLYKDGKVKKHGNQ